MKQTSTATTSIAQLCSMSPRVSSTARGSPSGSRRPRYHHRPLISQNAQKTVLQVYSPASSMPRVSTRPVNWTTASSSPSTAQSATLTRSVTSPYTRTRRASRDQTVPQRLKAR